MAGALKYKIFSPTGEYVASCKYAEDAASVCSLYGEGSTIRLGHAKKDIVFAEGNEALSYDEMARIIFEREKAA